MIVVHSGIVVAGEIMPSFQEETQYQPPKQDTKQKVLGANSILRQ